MKAADFILQIRSDLQEKSEFHKDKELFLKLQRCYSSLQFDLPSFIHRETLDITEGKKEYYLEYEPIKDISLVADDCKWAYTKLDTFLNRSVSSTYTFERDILLISTLAINTSEMKISYYYDRAIETEQCDIELPSSLHKALRLLVLSEIHEKPTLNSKQRDLSMHYMSLYEREIAKQKREQKTRAKNITSKFQRI
jgi:hypothetical protein